MLSIALTNDQGIPDQFDNNHEPYDGIIHMIHVAIEGSFHTDPEKSVLAKVGMKLAHPETYVSESDLEGFEVFVGSILTLSGLHLFPRLI